MHKVLVNRLGGLSLPRKSVVKLTDCLDMTLDVYRGRKTTIQQQRQPTGGTCPNDFSNPIDQDIHTHCAVSWKKWYQSSVGDCSVSERQQRRPPYQTVKTVHVHAKHNTHRGNVPDTVSYPGQLPHFGKVSFETNG